jgi:hypothetical protein
MRKTTSIAIAAAAAMLATTAAMADPRIDNWPWKDTTVHDNNTHLNICARFNSRSVSSGANAIRMEVKKYPTYNELDCKMFSDYKTSVGAPLPSCGTISLQNWCAMQDCQQDLQWRNEGKNVSQNTTYINAQFCARQDERGGEWVVVTGEPSAAKDDDSPETMAAALQYCADNPDARETGRDDESMLSVRACALRILQTTPDRH